MNRLVHTSSRLVLVLCLVAFASGCVSHPDPYVRRGRLGGAAVGAGLGAIIGHNVNGLSKGEGAIAGAVIGGILGDARAKANSSYDRQGRYRSSSSANYRYGQY